MNGEVKEARRLLKSQGFSDVTFTGRKIPHWQGVLLEYTYPGGVPVYDGPGVYVHPSGRVELLPWMDSIS